MDGEGNNQPVDNNMPDGQDGAQQQPMDQQIPADVPDEQQQMDMDDMMGGGPQ